MSTQLFDLEHLQQLTYERSKTWSSFLDNVAKNETLEEFEIDKLDEIYGAEFDENDNNDELASMEDDDSDVITLDPDELKQVSSVAQFSLLFNSKTLTLPERTKNEENNKLFDIFNQTMPIINEHNRQMKESGFERILSSFDKQKIEDKVGSWLNRHNSLYGGDNTLLYTVSKKKDYIKERQTSSAKRRGSVSRSLRNRSSSSKEVSNDSDDSLQSGETARYIRSSRAGAMKNASSTTTMIKTYRMVKSTREALREKYACERADDDCHLKALRHRRRFLTDLEYHHNHYDLARLQKSRKHEMKTLAPPPPSSSRKERRKVLRKRTHSNSCSNMDSSSDSDYYYKEDHRLQRKHLAACCNQHYCPKGRSIYPDYKEATKKPTQRSAIKMPSARMNRMYYYTHSQTKSLSSSSSSSTTASFSRTCERRRTVKKNCKLYTDNRPCRRESECRCCNERKLCEDYKHVADTSTEEWYVENCCSPKKSVKMSLSHSTSYKSLTIATETLPSITEMVNDEAKTKQNTKPRNQKTKTSNTKMISDAASTTHDETFDRELQMAIQASKDLYEKEQEMKINENIVKKKEKHEIIPTKPLRKSAKKTNNQQDEHKDTKRTTTSRKRQTNKHNNVLDKDDEVTEKLLKLVEVKVEANEVEIINSSDAEDIFIKPQAVPVKMPTKRNKQTSITTTEETFFGAAPTQTICNSTALTTNSSAYNRQFTDNLREQDEVTLKKHSKTKETKTKTLRSSTATKKAATSTVMEKKEETKKLATSTTVTSTTIRSPEINSTLTSTTTTNQTETLLNSWDDLSDCTLVTSTTNIELPPANEQSLETLENTTQQQDATLSSNHPLTHKGILIYAPHNRSLAPANSFTSDGYFTITREHLSSIIGDKPAEKFLKHYIGRKRFNSNSTIYFRPPSTGSLDGNNMSSSSDSDDDLDSLGLYGYLYESLN